MKKVIMVYSIALLFISFSCKNDSSENAIREYDERPLIEYRNKIKDALLPNYNNDRPYPGIISEREAIEGMIDELFSLEGYDYTYERLQSMPELKQASVGDIVLVENLSVPEGDRNKFYYYINAIMPDGYIIAEGIADANADSDHPGQLGIISYAQINEIPGKYVNKSEAICLLREKFIIDDANAATIKAVFLPRPGDYSSYLGWGWSVKFKNPVILDSRYKTHTLEPVFWVSRDMYDYEEAVSRNIIKRSDIVTLNTVLHIAVVTQDIFNNEITNNMTRMSSYGFATEDFTQFIPLEYMAE